MPALKLFLLGSPRSELDGAAVVADTRKATALLAYLVLGGERLSRDALAAFLWPEFDDARARAALRRTLSALKATVGEDALYATREHIGVETGRVWCDVIAFRAALAGVKTHNHAPGALCPACESQLATAATLYRDDFMSGFSLRDSIPFDDWQLQQAEALRRDLVAALEQLVLSTQARQALEESIGYAQRWVQLDPLREEAYRHLMRLYAWSGRRSAALLQYRACVRVLDEELGVPPLPETTALYQAIQDDQIAKLSPVESVPAPASPARPAVPGTAIIGREVELALMQQIYQRVGPDGRLLVIEGEPGIGKTRLAEALVARVAAGNAVTLSARCYEGESSLAYAPLIHALEQGLAAADRDRVGSLPAHHLAEASRLLPQLAIGRALPPLPALDAPGERVRFYEGLAQLLVALLDGAAPGILWLDDAHWLDAASQAFLLYLLHRWEQRPFLLLLCWRAEDLPADNPLQSLAATLRHAGISETIRPARFTVDHVRELLDAAGAAYAPGLPGQLFEETEGLPFFVVEYLNALAQDEGLEAAATELPVPASVRALLHNRLARISPTERQILQAAAAIGHSFDLPLVQAASGRGAEETVTALEMLAGRGLLVEHGAVYDFSHDKLQALVNEEMGLARQRLLHRRLAEALGGGRAVPGAALSAQIAIHYQLAGLEAEAAAYYRQAGDQARALFAHEDAIHYYRSALALGAEAGWQLHAAVGELSMRLGVYLDALASYETAAALAPAAELPGLEHRLAQVYQRQGNWSLAAHTLAQAQGRLDEAADPAVRAHMTLDRSLVAHRQKQPEEALRLAQQAHALATTAGDGPTLALANNILGMLARSRGELAAAISLLEQSRRLAGDSERLDIQIAACNNLALTLNAAGQTAAAREHLEEALALCARYGDRHYEAALRSNLADVLHGAGEDPAAQEQVRLSATIYAEIGRDQENWRPEIWQLMEW